MQRNLGYPAFSSMKKYVANGYILNLSITPRQIEEAIIATGGRTTEEMKGKAQPKHQTLPPNIRQQVESKTITLNIDLMFLKSNVFLITISDPICYTTSSHLRNRTWTELGRELIHVIGGYTAKGHQVTRLRSDNEGCVVASQHILGLRGSTWSSATPSLTYLSWNLKYDGLEREGERFYSQINMNPPTPPSLGYLSISHTPSTLSPTPGPGRCRARS